MNGQQESKPAMSNSLLTGKLTRLIAADPETRGELMAKWSKDSEFSQLFNTDLVQPRGVKDAQEWSKEHWAKEEPDRYQFMIQRLEDDHIIGETGLGGTLNPHGDCW